MKIHSESRIHHPREQVYLAYRDRLPELAAYIPDIKEIRVLSSEAGPLGPILLNEWVGERELPKAVQGLLKPEWLTWHDFARWDDAEHHVDWRIELPAFPGQAECAGRNAFLEDGPNATRVLLSGDLRLKIERVPGVPSFMVRRLIPMVEEVVVKLITPNLQRINESLERFLDAEH